MSARLDRDGSLRDPRILRDFEAGLAYHRAERLYRKVLRREPNQPDALRLLGVIASERGRHEYAVQLISRALANLPGSAEAHYDLGHAVQALGRRDEAADHYQAAITLRPDFAQAHCNLAALLIRQDQHGAAVEHATRAAELMTRLVEAHLYRGIALACGRRFGEAEAALRRALAVRPDNAQALSEL